MEPEQLPLDPLAAAALVVRLVDEIDSSDDEDRMALLDALASAAWGGAIARNQ